MDLGAMTVSLRADLSGLDAGLRQAQELMARAAQGLEQQEERFRQAGAAARDYGQGAAQSLAGATDAAGALGRSAAGLQQRWGVAWEAMDSAAEVALGRMTRRFGHAVAAMVVDGRGLRDFWRGLWRDLVEIAVQRLLQMVLETRGAAAAMRDALGVVGGGLLGGVGGLVGIFGGVGKLFKGIGKILGFDNPVHDAWARKQGFDFAKHFRAGVTAAMAAPFGTLPPTLSPALASAGIGSIRGAQFRAVSIQPGAFIVNISAQNLDERTVRDAGAILADEVGRRLGWTERRSGV